MLRLPLCFLFLLAGLLFVVGCGDPESPGTADESGAGTDNTNTGDNANAKDALEGRWLMIAGLLDRPVEISLAVVEIGQGQGGKLAAEVLSSHEEFFPEAQVVSFKAGQGRLNVKFELPSGGELDVEGTLDGDVVLGNAPTNSGLQPIRFERTQESQVAATEATFSEGAETFIAAMQSDAPVRNLRQYVKQFSTSPTALTASIQLIALSKREGLERADVERNISDFIEVAKRWGPRMEQMSRAQSAYILARNRYLPELALEVLEPLEKTLSQEDAKDIAPQLEYTKALAQLFTRDEPTQKLGEATLRRLNDENPLNYRFRNALAEYNEQTGATDDALRFYSEVAVLPGGEEFVTAEQAAGGDEGERPSAAATRLWNAKHGNTQGLEGFLDEVYTKLIHGIADGAEPVASPGTRVTLCEVFTGAACPPCVAADVATTGLETQYDKSRLIVLRYHMHVPIPDPLSNADSETRYDYYEAFGTPTVVLNGRVKADVLGPLSRAPFEFERLRKSVDELVKEDSPLRIGVSAEAKDGQLQLTAQVDGLDEVPSTLRLRLVLAEDSIDFIARNGIRKHEMVVRAMPGGAQGVAPQEGRLAFTATIPLATIKQNLVDYLDKYEQQFDLRFAPPELIELLPNGVFPEKPLELKPLHFVAFVQDDATREILQAAAVPVSGTLEFPVAAPAPASKAKSGAGGRVEPPIPQENEPPADATPPSQVPVPGKEKG